MLRSPLTRLAVVVAMSSIAVVGFEALVVGSAIADDEQAAPTQRVYGPVYTGPAFQGPMPSLGQSALHSPAATDHQGRKFQ